MSLLKDAREFVAAGISVIPADRTTKQPMHKGQMFSWKPYQKNKPTDDELVPWFSNGAALACVCGPVSGNLEIIDLDQEGVAAEWTKLLKSWNCEDLLKKVVTEQSQRKGGFHVAYRHSGKPEGNQKLAVRPATPEELADKPDEKWKTKIETRGEGGYCLVAPSPGYKLIQGSWLDLPIITAEEREALLAAARTFCEKPIERPKPAGDRVGDDFNKRGNIDEILVPLGWQKARSWGGIEEFWVRPGKNPNKGHSATFNYKGSGLFIVFSSSTELELRRGYDLFGLYAHLHHKGDFQAAAKALGDKGYGRPLSETVRHKNVGEAEPKARQWSSLGNVAPTEVDWLWKPYIPRGMVTLVYGDGGIGKSTAMLAVTTAVTLGAGLPKSDPSPAGNVILLSAEDPPDKVIVPRLIAMGADRNRVMVPDEFDENDQPNPMILDEDGAGELRNAIEEYDAQLVVIDPVLAYFEAARNMDKGTEVREWMRRLSITAKLTNCAIVLIHHSNKNSLAKAAYRAMGSVDFVNAARSALMAVQDPEDATNCALVHTKHNLSAKGQAVGYTVDCGEFKWTGISELTPEICNVQPQPRQNPRELKGCAAWLAEFLESSGPTAYGDVMEAAKINGYAVQTVKEASRKVPGFQSRKVGAKHWEWSIDTFHPDFEGVYRGGD